MLFIVIVFNHIVSSNVKCVSDHCVECRGCFSALVCGSNQLVYLYMYTYIIYVRSRCLVAQSSSTAQYYLWTECTNQRCTCLCIVQHLLSSNGFTTVELDSLKHVLLLCSVGSEESCLCTCIIILNLLTRTKQSLTYLNKHIKNTATYGIYRHLQFCHVFI